MKQEKREMRIGTIRGDMAKEMEIALDNERVITYIQVNEFDHRVLDVYVEVPVKK